MSRQANTHPTSSIEPGRGGNLRSLGSALLIFTTFSLTLLLGVTSASAAPKQAIAYFGTESGSGSLGGQFGVPDDVAVNATGAGPAAQGDIYVIDANRNSSEQSNERIQRFAQDDNGTPANPYDDTFPFISAWGAGVDSAATGDDYEICTVAANCKAGLGIGGNGTAAGNGALYRPGGIAIDQDTGEVYVLDAPFFSSEGNFRVNVYAGDGTFLRSFGWDVVESGPGNTGSDYEICVGANGDVCKAGTTGGSIGQLSFDVWGIAVSPPDGNPASGTVFVADTGNRRVNTYNLDGTSPSSFGSAANFSEHSPRTIAVDSRGIVYASGNKNNSQIDRYDSQNANGGGVGFLAPIAAPPVSVTNTEKAGLEVDLDSDGAGPETDLLYVLRSGISGTTVVQQFGPVNKPGLTAPPLAEDEAHGALAEFNAVRGLGLDESSGRLFVSTNSTIGGPFTGVLGKSGVYVLDKAGAAAATASLESVSAITATSAVLHGKVNPNGPPDVSYRAEYSLDGVNWTTVSNTVLGSQESPQSVTPTLDPPGGGLEANTLYHVRLVATRLFNPPVISNELTFTTAVAPPLAETTGTPLRTTTTAQLLGRIDPSSSPASFHFEYGDQGPCDTNPCTSTAVVPAGSGGVYALASAQIDELEPSTTYHYRIVADNGNPGSPVFGQDATVTTRATDASLSHGHLPGPPGSDRAYEQVNLPDTGGNPVAAGIAFSDNGDRAVYVSQRRQPEFTGRQPLEPVLRRTDRNRPAHRRLEIVVGDAAARANSLARTVLAPSGPSDLSSFAVPNFSAAGHQRNLWRLSPSAPAQKLFEPSAAAGIRQLVRGLRRFDPGGSAAA